MGCARRLAVGPVDISAVVLRAPTIGANLDGKSPFEGRRRGPERISAIDLNAFSGARPKRTLEIVVSTAHRTTPPTKGCRRGFK